MEARLLQAVRLHAPFNSHISAQIPSQMQAYVPHVSPNAISVRIPSPATIAVPGLSMIPPSHPQYARQTVLLLPTALSAPTLPLREHYYVPIAVADIRTMEPMGVQLSVVME